MIFTIKNNKQTGIAMVKQNISKITTKLPPVGLIKKSLCQNSFFANKKAALSVMYFENGKKSELINATRNN